MGETTYKPGVTDKFAYTDTAAQSDAFTTTKVRIWCSTDAHVAFGANPTATTAGMPLTGKVGEYFDVVPGEKASIIRQSDSGDAYITSMSKE